MPDENDTAWPPSSPPRTASKASHVSVASVRLYRRSVPSTKFDAGTSGVFRGAPGTRSGRPPTMAQVSGFMCLQGSHPVWIGDHSLAAPEPQYARKKDPRHDPNDRGYDRDLERKIKHMAPEELDRLLR